MPRTRKPKTTALPEKFSTGFLTQLDGRQKVARALRANYDAIVQDIGGSDEVGHVKAALIERFVWLEGILQTLEHEMSTGATDRNEAVGKWIAAVNSLSGLAKVLGVQRKGSSKPWSGLDLPQKAEGAIA